MEFERRIYEKSDKGGSVQGDRYPPRVRSAARLTRSLGGFWYGHFPFVSDR